jgi:hypothetical protein
MRDWQMAAGRISTSSFAFTNDVSPKYDRPEIWSLRNMISPSERRSKDRIAARVPVRVRTAPAAPEISAVTRDISFSGVFLYTKSRMVEGSEVELVLIFPPELTAGVKSWICCHARVLRVESGPGKEFGVAAAIHRMDVLPELPAT